MHNAAKVNTQVRYPLELYTWLEQRAANNGRSRNGELMHILKTLKAQDEASSKKQSTN